MVREVVDITFAEAGKQRIYLMSKRNWNTLDAIEAIARESGIPASSVRYAGLKDRHALTHQYVSVPSDKELRSSREDIRLIPVGRSDDFVSTKVLVGNSFEVTLRSLDDREAESVEARVPEVREWGFPNHFDDQRFGPASDRGEFVAERLVKGHLRGALKLYLTAEREEDPGPERERKRELSGAWGDWDKALALCRTPLEERLVGLAKLGGKKNLQKAVNSIPARELALHLAAFQGFLWNRALMRYLEMRVPELATSSNGFTVPGRVGPYLFYRRLSRPSPGDLSRTMIPTVARKILPCDPDVLEAVQKVLEEQGLSLSGFALRGLTSAYFKSFYRQAAVIPEKFEAFGPEPDELYSGKSKLRLSFFLPRGSYATMLVKALTGASGD